MFSSLSFIFAHHLIRSFEWMNSWKVCVHESSAKNQIKNFGERAKRSFDIFWLDLHSFSSEANPPKNLFYLSKWNMKWAGTKLIICVPLNLKIKDPFEIPSCIIILAIEFLCAWIKEPWKNVVWWPAPPGTFQITFGIETATSSRRNWSIQSASLFLGWFVLQNYEKRSRHFWKRQVTIEPIHRSGKSNMKWE